MRESLTNQKESLEERLADAICFYSHRDVVPEDQEGGGGDTTVMTYAEAADLLSLLIDIRDRLTTLKSENRS